MILPTNRIYLSRARVTAEIDENFFESISGERVNDRLCNSWNSKMSKRSTDITSFICTHCIREMLCALLSPERNAHYRRCISLQQLSEQNLVPFRSFAINSSANCLPFPSFVYPTLAQLFAQSYMIARCSNFRNVSLPLLNAFLVIVNMMFVPTLTSDSQCQKDTNFDAMLSLLGSHEIIEALFDSNFERSYMHVSHSGRSDRVSWMHHYRRFLPDGDLDLILSFNVSATSTTSQKPLILYHDIDILRVVEVDGLFRWVPISVKPQLAAFRAAVRDGAVLNMYHMSSRSRLISVFEDALRSFWSVPLSTTFMFHPTLTATQASPAPEIYANDIFLVTLHGVAKAHLYTDCFPFPSQHHVESSHILQTAHDDLAMPQVIDLYEGDVLYLPRGTGIDIRTTNSMALFIRFEIHTSQRQIVDGILKAVNITARSSKFLGSRATTADDNRRRSAPKWSQIISTAARMAGEFTPTMRRFLPIQKEVENSIGQTGQMVGIRLIEESLMRFSRAAESKLFDPVMEILASDDDSVYEIASNSVIKWAKRIQELGGEQQNRARRMFRECVEEISLSTSATNVLYEMSDDWQNNEQSSKRQEQLKIREKNMERHNQKNPL